MSSVTFLPASRPSSMVLQGPRGSIVTVRRSERGRYAVRHQLNRSGRVNVIVGSQRRAIAVAERYARRFA